MTESRVTLRDIYDAVNNLETKISTRIDKIDNRVAENTAFRNQLVGKITAVFVIVGIGINWVWDLFVNKKW